MAELSLKQRLLAGEPVLGAWLMFSDAFVAEVMAHAGWDWLLVDMEHGPVSLDAATAMVTAIRTTRVVPFVRPAWNESSQIQRALDLGCTGIVVPVVNDAEDARRVVRDARYPPLGERSRGGVRPQLAFGMDAMTYFERSNHDVIVLVQIETETAVRNVAEIVAVEGIDGIFLGPNDLAASGGKGWPDVWNTDAAYMDAVARVAAVTRAAGKIAGFLARDAAMAKQVADMGYRFIGVSSDAAHLTAAAKRTVDATRAELTR